MQQVGPVTQLLIRWSDGDKGAADELMPIIYDELHRMAATYLRRERSNLSIQATGLVHEAYIRMVEHQQVSLATRAQFFGLASKLMRNILVDLARQRKATKRGGPMPSLALSEADRVTGGEDVDLLALDQALQELAATRPRHGRIVELRFFGGLVIEEVAEVLDVSHATVEREWHFAKAWLRRKLGSGEGLPAWNSARRP
jgi:RNA polymerase sigma factor (TIGR02999 family)